MAGMKKRVARSSARLGVSQMGIQDGSDAWKECRKGANVREEMEVNDKSVERVLLYDGASLEWKIKDKMSGLEAEVHGK